MKSLDFSSFLLIIGIWLLQVLLLNEIELFAFINPYVYPLIILILPADTQRLKILLLAFFLGWGVDIFEGSGGIHAFATTTIGFIRPALLRLVATQGGLEFEKLSLKSMGIRRFSVYVLSTLFIHHYLLFAMDGFSLRGLIVTIPEAAYTSLFSLVVILMGYVLLSRKKESVL
jgi:rod shape-determining protein MreD